MTTWLTCCWVPGNAAHEPWCQAVTLEGRGFGFHMPALGEAIELAAFGETVRLLLALRWHLRENHGAERWLLDSLWVDRRPEPPPVDPGPATPMRRRFKPGVSGVRRTGWKPK